MQIIKQSTATLYAIQYKCALTELAIETDATNPKPKGGFANYAECCQILEGV